jgi:glycosyltransferase involved in cell wall biosynthesis
LHKKTKQPPKVTIGLPFCNNRSTLGDSIRSVFAQTFQDWELILLDDASSDGSLELAHSIQDHRVTVLSNNVNRGLPASLNQITQLARGEYIARMDADDLMHPLRIEKQVRYLDERSDIDLVDTAFCTIDSLNNPIGVRGCGGLDISPRTCLAHGVLNHPSILARATWMRRNPYDESYRSSQDYELWCRTVASGDCRFERLPEPFLFYREEGSIRLCKVLRTHHFMSRAILAHGPKLVGVPQTFRYLVQTYGKSLIWVGASVLGVSHLVYRRRSKSLDDESREQALAAIRTILHTHVPGLERASDGIPGRMTRSAA